MARPFLTDEQVQAGQERLCRVALEVYRAKGYAALSLREVAAVAGISYATPYRYFRSKEDLVSHVRAEVFTHFREHLQAADPLKADPLSRLRRIVEAVVSFANAAPDDYRLIFSMRQPPPTPGTPLDQTRKKTIDYVVGVCQAAIDAGQMQGPALTQVHVAWASIHGLVSLHVSNLLAQGLGLEDLIKPVLDRLFAPSPVTRPAREIARAETKKKASRESSARRRRQ